MRPVYGRGTVFHGFGDRGVLVSELAYGVVVQTTGEHRVVCLEAPADMRSLAKHLIDAADRIEADPGWQSSQRAASDFLGGEE
jgi:hypothetical protein